MAAALWRESLAGHRVGRSTETGVQGWRQNKTEGRTDAGASGSQKTRGPLEGGGPRPASAPALR